MDTATSWALWLAIAAVLPVVGKFVDDYHIRASTKSRVRDKLIAAFIWLHDHPVPEIGRRLVAGIVRIPRAIGCGCGCSVILFGAIALAAWISPQHKLAVDPVGQVVYVLIIISPGIFAGFIGSYISVLFARRLAKVRSDIRVMMFGLIGPLAVVAALAGIAAVVSWLDWMGIYGAVLAMLATGALSIPIFVAWGIYLSLIIAKLALAAIRSIAMAVLDASSDPRQSPFAYAAALMSLGVLFLKIAKEALGVASGN